MITRLLVANRGEIARRVFATCRRLGIETVAVHSDADAGLPFVGEADAAVRLPGNTPAETYLRTDLILDAARRSGADAIHPGYGFLSENADVARAVLEAGLTWVGPSPESIEAMGSKVGARHLVQKYGVPVLDEIDPADVTEADLPLLVKASAGGGGRGMRVVRALADVAPQVASAAAEAESAFGDPTVFCEAYVEHGRHVEVQVVGTPEGVLVFGERDCSLQRRHQKVVEEAPAPGLPETTREALHEAARQAAAAVDYQGAGTVEFLLDAADPTRFWFLEMNTRLQVEHPVTEAVFGVDLVELQLAVAEGRGLDTVLVPRTYSTSRGGSTNRAPQGHAIEVRLYAEDPAADHQPQSGRLTTFEVPGAVEFERAPLRLDSGFESGNEVSTFYDAMLAKLIVHAPTREQAARQLAGALKRARLHGLTTNRDQLVQVLEDPAFLAGDVSTAFLGAMAGRAGPRNEARIETTQRAAVAAALALAEYDASRRTVQRGIPVAWRNVPSQPQVTRFVSSGSTPEELEVHWWGGRDGYVVEGYEVISTSSISGGRSTRVALTVDGVTSYAEVLIDDADPHRPREVHVDGLGSSVSVREQPRFTDPATAHASGSLLAPMPGTVISVAAEPGQQVEAGQPVLVLEAMKMQHTVSAPQAGTVTEIPVHPGQQVAAGDVLAVVEGADA